MQVPGRLNNARGSAFPTKTSHTMHQRRMSTRLELGAASRIADGLDAQNGVVTMLSSGSSSSILSTAWLALSSLLKSATMRSDKQLSLNNYTATTFHDNISTLVMGSCMNKIRSSSLSSWFNKDVSGSSLEKKKVLILMSDTGGGHRASAQALQEALLEISNNKAMVTILDIWTKHSVWPFNKAVTTYRFLAKHPMLWRAMYRYGQFAPTRTLTELYSSCVNYKKFYKAVNDHSPDIVLSVHPLCQSLPISVLKNINAERAKDNKQRIPFVTVVTDLGSAHPTWFDNDVDACFVPSEAVLKLAISNGMPAQKVHLRGLLMRPKFWSKSALSKEKAREQLGWSKNLKTALLMGGGDGVGGMDSIATSLAEKLNSLDNTSQLVVICGHNNQLYDQLTAKLTSRRFPRLSVKVEGFVHNIDCYMSASDCLITKAGPGTIVEAMTRGLPLILSSYLPGQVNFFFSLINVTASCLLCHSN